MGYFAVYMEQFIYLIAVSPPTCDWLFAVVPHRSLRCTPGWFAQFQIRFNSNIIDLSRVLCWFLRSFDVLVILGVGPMWKNTGAHPSTNHQSWYDAVVCCSKYVVIWITVDDHWLITDKLLCIFSKISQCVRWIDQCFYSCTHESWCTTYHHK